MVSLELIRQYFSTMDLHVSEVASAAKSIFDNTLVIIEWILLRALSVCETVYFFLALLLEKPLWYFLKLYHSFKMSPYLMAFFVTFLCILFTVVYRRWFARQDDKTVKYRASLLACQSDLVERMEALNCHPLLLRLAWSDAATYDRSIKNWPSCGGCNGHIRFDEEIRHQSNAGLSSALEIIKPIKKKYPILSWADVIQMAGAVAVETLGGPHIPMVYGRCDSKLLAMKRDTSTKKGGGGGGLTPTKVNGKLATGTANRILSEEGFSDSDDDDEYDTAAAGGGSGGGFATGRNASDRGALSSLAAGGGGGGSMCLAARQPNAAPPYLDGAPTADIHIRNTLYRMGLNNKDIVVLLGAHTIGRAFNDRSGVCPHKSGDQDATKYTRTSDKAKGKPATYMTGGCSWTKNWLVFDNSYFKRLVRRVKAANSSKRSFIPSALGSQFLSSNTNANTNTNTNTYPLSLAATTPLQASRNLFQDERDGRNYDSDNNSNDNDSNDNNDNDNDSYDNDSYSNNHSNDLNSKNARSSSSINNRSNRSSYSSSNAKADSSSSSSNNNNNNNNNNNKSAIFMDRRVGGGRSSNSSRSSVSKDSDEDPVSDDDSDGEEDLLWLPIDQCLIDCPDFLRFVLQYGENHKRCEQAFFRDYSLSHRKMSELGCLFDPPEGVSIEDLYPSISKK